MTLTTHRLCKSVRSQIKDCIRNINAEAADHSVASTFILGIEGSSDTGTILYGYRYDQLNRLGG